MTQYNTTNVKLSNSQLNMLKSAIKNGTEVTLNLSSNSIGNYNDKTNFPHKLLLTDVQLSEIRKAFANGSSANIKFSKTHLSKIVQSGGFIPFEIFFRRVRIIKKIINETDKLSKKVTLKDIIKTSTDTKRFIKKLKNASDKALGTGITLRNNEIKDITKVIKSLENRGILLKGTTRQITSQNEDLKIFLDH